MTGPRDHLVERKQLNRMEFAYLALEQGGICGCGCGATLTFLDPRSVTDEHIKPLSMGGTNDLINRSLWTTPCARAKTSGEAPILAKCKRLAGETGVNRKRKEIPSRGFQSPPPNYSHFGKRGPSNVKVID